MAIIGHEQATPLPRALVVGLRMRTLYRRLDTFWQSRSRWQRVSVGVLVALYMCLWGVCGALHLNVTDLDVFFLPSARVALSGHPLLIYTVRYQIIYPNANGPLSIIPLTAVAAFAARLGWLNDPQLRRMLIMGFFSLFMLLMSREAVLLAERLRGKPFPGLLHLLAYAPLVFSPQLWHSVLLYGHIEQPIMLWLTLAGVRAILENRPRRAGLFFGLALLTRSVALLYLIPVALLLVRRRHWLSLLWLIGESLVIPVLGLLPFWLADHYNLMYSLLTFRGQLPVSGGSLTGLAHGTSLEAFAQAHDSAIVIVAVVLLTIISLALRRDLDITSSDVPALLALASLCFPLFMKTLWPYYFLDPYVFLTLWWLTSARGLERPIAWAFWWLGLLLPVGIVVSAQIGEQGVIASLQGPWPLPWTLLTVATVLLITLIVALWIWLGQRHLRALILRIERLTGVTAWPNMTQEARGILPTGE